MSVRTIYFRRGFLALYVLTIFLSAALLFWSELMIAKLLLPLFGGSPAVWNTCMVFFQITLLFGYAYAHWSVKTLGVIRQLRLHAILILLPLLTIPLVVPDWASAGESTMPTMNLIATLFVVLGATFFILSTTGPLLQRWFAASLHPHASQPYFLYAASNLASFVALVSYPFFIEPAFSLQTQIKIWSAGYGIFVVCVLLCAVALYRYRGKQPKPLRTKQLVLSTRLLWNQRLRWVLFAAVPSSLMLGVTTYITTDVASMPLLWMIPLAIYLLSFVIAFAAKKPLQVTQWMLPYIGAGLVAWVALVILPLDFLSAATAILYLAVFGLIAVAAHSALAGRRPKETSRLTEFYLWLALGGVVGGVFNSLVAPVVFNDLYELPLVLLASLVLFVSLKSVRAVRKKTFMVSLVPVVTFILIYFALTTFDVDPGLEASAAIIGFLLSGAYILAKHQKTAFAIGMAPLVFVPIVTMATDSNLLKDRTFYGVIKVNETDEERTLTHGFTKHGSQYIDEQRSKRATTYYHEKGPVGDLFKHCQDHSSCDKIGVIGLGAGTIAAYGRSGDTMTFYEIDPSVAEIASDPKYFTYLSDSQAAIHTVLGDGRLTLNDDTNKYDLLVVDAFSSDAIPTHLLTKEAVDLYRAKLTDQGVIAVHISNRHLNLEPVMRAIAKSGGSYGYIRYDQGTTKDDSHYGSSWAVLSDSSEIKQILDQPGWRELRGQDIRVWTDDYTNILDVLF